MPFEVVATPKLDRFSLWRSNSDLQKVTFGFEFEFASDYSHEDFADTLRDTLSLRSSQVHVDEEYNSGSKDYSIWNVEGDCSIPTRSGQYEIELVSPPKDIGTWEHTLPAVLGLIADSGETVRGTGLHITFSSPGLSDLDPLKFALLINDAAIATTFGRGLHDYAVSYLDSVRKSVQREVASNKYDGLSLSGSDIPNLLREIRMNRPDSVYKTGKYSSINLSKLNGEYSRGTPSLIEIRSPGGYDYTSKTTEILKTCRIIASALLVATDDAAYADVYAHKFAKMMAIGSGPMITEGTPSGHGSEPTVLTQVKIGPDTYYVTAKPNSICFSQEAKGHSASITYDIARNELSSNTNGAVESQRKLIRLVSLILKTPAGGNLPGLPEDLGKRVEREIEELGATAERDGYSVDASTYGKRPSIALRISSDLEATLSRFVKPTAKSVVALCERLVGGGAATQLELDILANTARAVAGIQRSRFNAQVSDAEVENLTGSIPLIARALSAAAASNGDLFEIALQVAASDRAKGKLPDNFIHEMIDSYVDRLGLTQFGLSDLLGLSESSFFSGALSENDAAYLKSRVPVKIQDYLQHMTDDNADRMVLTAVRRVARNRTELLHLCAALRDYPVLWDSFITTISDFSSGISDGLLANVVWVVGELDIPEQQKLEIWRKQNASLPASAIMEFAKSVDPADLNNWVLASPPDRDSRTAVMKGNAVILFASMLKQGPQAPQAYDAVLAMYRPLTDDMRDKCTRYVFQQLSNISSNPRTAMWGVLTKFLTATLTSIAHATRSADAVLFTRLSGLVQFTDEIDRYLGTGSSYWRADRPKHIRDIQSILAVEIKIDGVARDLGALASETISPTTTVTMPNGESASHDGVLALADAVRGLTKAIGAIGSRPTA